MGVWTRRHGARLFTAAMTAAILLLPVTLRASSEGGHGGGPSLLLDMIIRVINFSILAFLLVKFLSKPIADFFSARSETIRGRLDTLKAERNEARSVLQEYTEKYETIEEEIARAKTEATEEMEMERKKILEEAGRTAEDIVHHAQETIKQEMIKAKAELHAEAVDLSLDLAEGLIHKNITDEDQRRFAEEYIRRIGKNT